jgi:N-acetylmuramoyl-L-alanine amidase
MVMKSWKSLNFDKRADNVPPSMIIMHYTGMKTEEAALKKLCDPAAKVSAHYFINENGETLNLVEDSRRAWHAGISYWDGITDINSHSIGIELVNPGHEHGYHEFPGKQMRALTNLCTRLIEKYEIVPSHILGHSDIAPKRKEDPGELFPWKQLAADGIGLWPRPQEADFSAAASYTGEPEFLRLLGQYGYNLDVPYGKLVMAYHRHFCPEKFGYEDPTIVDTTSVARLLALLSEKVRVKNLKNLVV